jgi:hypothetical protein
MPENRNLSPGNFPSEKIDRCPKLWTQKKYLLSVKESAGAKRGLKSFVAVQVLPHRCAQDTINFDSDQPRLFEHPWVSVLNKQETSQYTMSVEPKISQDKESLFGQAAPAQGTVDRQKGAIRRGHWNSVPNR